MIKCHEILGVPVTATPKEIKAAYKRLAMKFHPDRNSDTDTSEEFKKITIAYNYLMHGGSPASTHSTQSFEEIFGKKPASTEQKRVRRGEDTVFIVDISLEDAVNGIPSGVVNVPLWEYCPDCNGSGSKNKQPKHSCHECSGTGVSPISLTTCKHCHGTGAVVNGDVCNTCAGDGTIVVYTDIDYYTPAGINYGYIIRHPQKGKPGINGGVRGDLILKFNVANHELFRVMGNDIHTSVTFTLTQVLLGTPYVLQLLDSDTITINPPSLKEVINGIMISVPHKGVKHSGDLHVHVGLQDIVLSDEIRDFLATHPF